MTNRVVRNGTPHAHRFDYVALAEGRQGFSPTLFGYTDQSADPTVVPAGDPRLTTYEGVLPGFDVRLRLPEDEKPWLSWLGCIAPMWDLWSVGSATSPSTIWKNWLKP